MTAKELMIGDLVLIKPEMKPIKIAAVHQNKIGYHVRADKLNWVRFGLLEPIPLTPELLVANGFKEEIVGHVTKNGISDFPLYSLNEKIRLEYPKGQVLTIIGNDKNDIFINKHIQYVHQLQHAFRMLKYDDLADNFKVI